MIAPLVQTAPLSAPVASEVAFGVVFGVFVAAFLVLSFITVRWAVRRDRVRRVEWQRRVYGEAAEGRGADRGRP